MDQATAIELRKTHGTLKAAAQAAGIPKSTFADILKGKTRRSRTLGHMEAPADAAVPGIAVGGSADFVSPAELLKPYDLVGRALVEIKEVPRGQLLPDDALRRRLGVSSDRWRQARGSARLAGHWFEAPDRKLFWGSKDLVASTAMQVKELL